MRNRKKNKKANRLKYLTLPFLSLVILYLGLDFYMLFRGEILWRKKPSDWVMSDRIIN
jgi:hypothetical protein